MSAPVCRSQRPCGGSPAGGGRCALEQPGTRWPIACEPRGQTESGTDGLGRAPLVSGSPGPSVAPVCDGVAAFWFERAYAYQSHAVMHALDLVSVQLKLA